MPHYGTLRDYTFTEAADDLRGADLYARNNEKIGRIDDVVIDHTELRVAYMVVDSGGWLKSKKFLVPANRLREYERAPGAFQVDIDRENIERLPEYDEKFLQSEKDWSGYQTSYLDSWRHACDIGGTELAMAGDLDELCSPEAAKPGYSRREKPGRWSRFEDQLRRERAQLLQRCPHCQGERRAA
jgi:hypothetical protein